MNKFLLTRRSFLKAIGITPVAAKLYPFDLAERVGWPHFNPNHQYGDDPLCLTDFVKNKYDPIVKEILDIMDDGIKKTIPPRYRKRIDYLILNPKLGGYDPLSLRGFAAWKYSPNGKGIIRVE